MKHFMLLQNEPFKKIKEGSKTVEMRLYDEKRKGVKTGDIIEFTNRDTDEKIETEVIRIHLFESFEQMYKSMDKRAIGYGENETADYKDMEQYYPKEKQALFGVAGIEIKKKK